jgi:hypothetical protein
MMEIGGKCDRCGNPTRVTQASLFNIDMCCLVCIEMERAHPDFPRARARELDELSKGNFNFPGIGLPEDLKIKRSQL